ncbi:hypothetical protein AB0L57_32540 [Nocardia sp. NPDC052254]|uniref:hypothetical protein n=1 Tax=Nocardia sp. NPDC052254 TaxID=3155681 RepID=UPI003427B287
MGDWSAVLPVSLVPVVGLVAVQGLLPGFVSALPAEDVADHGEGPTAVRPRGSVSSASRCEPARPLSGCAVSRDGSGVSGFPRMGNWDRTCVP